jgi:hypothetical protein
LTVAAWLAGPTLDEGELSWLKLVRLLPPTTSLLCRNRVADFSRWKAMFASHEAAHWGAGLRLVHLWRGIEDPNNVFFLFEVADIDRAREFIGNPEAAQAGEVSGVIDGEYHFIEDAGG